MKSLLKTLYTALVQLLFPSRCPSCHAYTEREGQWCAGCLTDILRTKNLAYAAEVRHYISPVITVGKYDKGLRSLLHELKYQHNLHALTYFQPLLAKLNEQWLTELTAYDIVIPVPLHPTKLKERGFNQVDAIFKPWALAQHLNYCDILLRRKKTVSQYRLNRSERQQNLHDAFCLKPDISVQNKRCLLVDDIFTSGTTMASCAAVLLAHGADSVSGLVLASQADD